MRKSAQPRRRLQKGEVINAKFFLDRLYEAGPKSGHTRGFIWNAATNGAWWEIRLCSAPACVFDRRNQTRNHRNAIHDERTSLRAVMDGRRRDAMQVSSLRMALIDRKVRTDHDRSPYQIHRKLIRRKWRQRDNVYELFPHCAHFIE